MTQGIAAPRDMKIAVTSQNRKTITGHAGKCRKFWVYEIKDHQVVGKSLLELPLEQSFHESPQEALHPLDNVQVLISGGMGQGLQNRLKRKGIEALSTPETDPDRAVSAWLAGTLEPAPAEPHDHDHRHHHQGSAHSARGAQSPSLVAVDQLFSRMFKDQS
jgi:predicted Fe-Mo cluster-binding NifX family protein